MPPWWRHRSSGACATDRERSGPALSSLALSPCTAYSLLVHEAKRRKRDHSQTGGMVMAKRNPRKPASKSRRVSKEKPAAGARGKYLGHYGWMPDVPDQRDLVFATARVTTLPPSVDLRPGCPPIYDQGQLGSCTANAIAAAIQYEQIRQKEPKPFAPS